MHAVLTVARKEFLDGLRNRWALSAAGVFALLALGLSYFGAAASGQVGFTSLATTIVSLASLAVFLIPLIALLLTYDTIVGEEERGTLLLLLSYPLSRTQLLAGKFLGHAAILALSTVLGFGTAGLLIAGLSDELDGWALWRAFASFIASATLLGWVFAALAHVISAAASEKSRAAGLALMVWFLFVLVFDLGLLGALVAAGGRIDAALFQYLLLLNPTDVFRLFNLTGFEATRDYAGLVSVAPAGTFSPALLLAILASWVALPFGLAVWLFRRRAA